MGVQFIPREQSQFYNPARDWAYNYPALVECVISAFNRNYWPELRAQLLHVWLFENGELTHEEADAESWNELCKAKDAYCAFLSACAGQQNPHETMEQVLEKSGLLACHPMARATWLAMLGEVMTGQLFVGLRDITELGAGPSPGVQKITETNDLLAGGMEARRILNRHLLSDDLRLDLATIARRLREQNLSWDTIIRIVQREQALEEACSPITRPGLFSRLRSWWRGLVK